MLASKYLHSTLLIGKKGGAQVKNTDDRFRTTATCARGVGAIEVERGIEGTQTEHRYLPMLRGSVCLLRHPVDTL